MTSSKSSSRRSELARTRGHRRKSELVLAEILAWADYRDASGFVRFRLPAMTPLLAYCFFLQLFACILQTGALSEKHCGVSEA